MSKKNPKNSLKPHRVAVLTIFAIGAREIEKNHTVFKKISVFQSGKNCDFSSSGKSRDFWEIDEKSPMSSSLVWTYTGVLMLVLAIFKFSILRDFFFKKPELCNLY